ncbi:TonB family protein [Labilibaculum filiforme]|nr:TonB family protein [Labilibaculum filiforme]
MKSILLGLIFSFSSSILFAQTEYLEVLDVNSKAKTSEEYFVRQDQNDIKEGRYLFKYRGKVQVKGEYFNNNKIGEWIYTPSSNFRIVGNYKENRKEGEWLYTQNGTQISILNYTSGLLEGKQFGYFENGSLACELIYRMGKRNGVEKRYYSNGKIKEVTNYKDDMIHGENVRYAEDGAVISKLIYEKDIPLSLEVQSDSTINSNYSGNLTAGNGILRTVNFKDNKEQVLLVRNFKDSLLDGEIIGYNYDGYKIFTGQYQKGNMIGTWKFYNPVGGFSHTKEYLLTQKLKVDSTETFTLKLNERFINIEDMPKFEGNDLKLFQYFISRIVKYPISCLNNGIKGKVYVSFVLSKEGKVEEVSLDNSVHPLIDQESLYVVNSSPFWIPGFASRIPVKISFTVPINFDYM